MRYYFYQAIEWSRWLVGLVPRSSIGAAQYYLIFHYTFITVVAILLAAFTVELREVLPLSGENSPLPEVIKRFWYGILFLIVYGLVRSVVWLLSLLGPDGTSDFPQLEQDWQEILTALEQERLSIAELPLFLVNGLTPDQEANAFVAVFENLPEGGWKAIAPAPGSAATVRAYANDSAIYLCTSGIGATSAQLGKLSKGQSPRATARPRMQHDINSVSGTIRADEGPPMDAGKSPLQTLSSQEPAVAPIGYRQEAELSPMATMLPGAMKNLMETMRGLTINISKGVGRQKLDPLSSIELLAGRRQLQFLCSMISSARFPWIGINGLLQAIPLSWASSTQYAGSLAPSIRSDIQEIHTSLHLQCPLVAVVTELDDVTGVREFIQRGERLAPGLRKSRAGSSFPAGAEVNERNAEWLVDAGLRWFRGWTYRAFSEDLDSRENTRLFQMVCELGERREGLKLILREAFYKTLQPAARLQGLYFAATGKSNTEQGFIPGLLEKLPQCQNDVAWNPAWIASRQQRKVYTIACFAGAGICLTICALLLARILQ